MSDLPEGWDLSKVRGLAVHAAATSHGSWPPFAERVTAAQDAVIDALLSGETQFRVLMDAADTGIRRYVYRERQTHGLAGSQDGTHRGWQLWWYPPKPHGASPWEEKLIDHLALWQIWPALTPGHRDAILAYANAGADMDRTAAILDLTPKAAAHRLSRARAEFRGWWHQGETPSRHWGRDYHGTGTHRRPLHAMRAIRTRARRRAAA